MCNSCTTRWLHETLPYPINLQIGMRPPRQTTSYKKERQTYDTRS